MTVEEMMAQHMTFKKKYPDREETEGKPYAGISNLRPETKEFVEDYLERIELSK